MPLVVVFPDAMFWIYGRGMIVVSLYEMPIIHVSDKSRALAF